MPGNRGGENDDENSSIILLSHTSIEHGILMKNPTDSRGDRRGWQVSLSACSHTQA